MELVSDQPLTRNSEYEVILTLQANVAQILLFFGPCDPDLIKSIFFQIENPDYFHM